MYIKSIWICNASIKWRHCFRKRGDAFILSLYIESIFWTVFLNKNCWAGICDWVLTFITINNAEQIYILNCNNILYTEQTVKRRKSVFFFFQSAVLSMICTSYNQFMLRISFMSAPLNIQPVALCFQISKRG